MLGQRVRDSFTWWPVGIVMTKWYIVFVHTHKKKKWKIVFVTQLELEWSGAVPVGVLYFSVPGNAQRYKPH